MLLTTTLALLLTTAPLADVPLVVKNGLFFLDATDGRGHSLRLNLDTGTEYNSISIAKAQSAGFPMRKTKYPGYFDVGRQSLHIGAFTTSPVPAIAGFDMGKYGNILHEPIDGVLSYNAFRGAVLQIDYRRHRLRIYRKSPPVPAGTVTEPMRVRRYNAHFEEVPVFDGIAIDGHPIVAEFDTMAPQALVLLDDKQAFVHRRTPADFAANKYWAHAQRVQHVDRSDLRFGSAALDGARDAVYVVGAKHRKADAGLDAAAGNALWEDAVVTLDFRRMTLSLSRKT